MRKRPLDPSFNQKVLDKIKISTIRDKAWPLNTPFMLYNWSGKPYRSKQVDVAAVEVTASNPLVVTHNKDGSITFLFQNAFRLPRPLFECEGFESKEAMDDWFRKVIPKGRRGGKYLMQFKLLHPA